MPIQSSGPSFADAADLAAALLDTLGVQRPVVAHGVSGGGPTAIEFAARHRGKTSGLLLDCSVSTRYVSPALSGACTGCCLHRIMSWQVLNNT